MAKSRKKKSLDTANMVVVHWRGTNNVGGPQTSQSTSSVQLKAEGPHVVHYRPPALPLISNPPFSCSVCPLIPNSTQHRTFLYIHFFLISRR